MLWPIGPVTTELSQVAARPVCRGDRQREDCAPSCPLPTVRSRSSARSRSWSTRGPAFYIAKECDEPGVGEPEGPRPGVVNGGRDWQMSPESFRGRLPSGAADWAVVRPRDAELRCKRRPQCQRPDDREAGNPDRACDDVSLWSGPFTPAKPSRDARTEPDVEQRPEDEPEDQTHRDEDRRD